MWPSGRSRRWGLINVRVHRRATSVLRAEKCETKEEATPPTFSSKRLKAIRRRRRRRRRRLSAFFSRLFVIFTFCRPPFVPFPFPAVAFSSPFICAAAAAAAAVAIRLFCLRKEVKKKRRRKTAAPSVRSVCKISAACAPRGTAVASCYLQETISSSCRRRRRRRRPPFILWLFTLKLCESRRRELMDSMRLYDTTRHDTNKLYRRRRLRFHLTWSNE